MSYTAFNFFELQGHLPDTCKSSSQTEIFVKMKVWAENMTFSKEFQNLRLRAINAEDEQTWISVFVETWMTLSQMYPSETEEFYLPPPYHDLTCQPAFIDIIKRIWGEQLALLGTGRQFVLHGIKGVGKTTVQLVCGLVTAILCPNIFPIYWDFSLSSNNGTFKENSSSWHT